MKYVVEVSCPECGGAEGDPLGCFDGGSSWVSDSQGGLAESKDKAMRFDSFPDALAAAKLSVQDGIWTWTVHEEPPEPLTFKVVKNRENRPHQAVRLKYDPTLKSWEEKDI